MLLVLVLLLSSAISNAKLITVKTSRGSVQGFDHDFGDDKTQTFYGYGQLFLGIPYAKAPLGKKRFTLTEDICQYSDTGEVHNATYYRPRCWQFRDSLQPADNMDEDCLYLNVYSPDVTGSYPVMFYIPGGSFTTGGGDVYDWRGAVRNLVSRGVVVVTINYRVGVIGFFTTFTENFPPNRGMYDMMMALRWVNEEISHFGGDTTRITIFGQSAGASAVSHLGMSPMARGLFHQQIQNSGSIMLEILTPEPERGSIDKERAKQICNMTDTSNWQAPESDAILMDCLVNASPQEIIKYDMTTGKYWAPSIDGAILPDYPENLAKIRPHYPLIAIDMMEEAASTPPGSTDRLPMTGPNTALLMWEGFWYFRDHKAVNELNEYAINVFSNGTSPDKDDHLGWDKLDVDMNTGMLFNAMFLRDIKWQTQYGNEKVWLFTLAHRSELPFPIAIEDWIPVRHCADLPYIWFYADIWSTYNASAGDFATADHFGRIWTDFAKNGKIDYPTAGVERNYIEIDEELTMKSNWRETTDDVFNRKGVELFGEAPNLAISPDGWAMLNELGPKIKAKWEEAKAAGCPAPEVPTTTATSTTAKAVSTTTKTTKMTKMTPTSTTSEATTTTKVAITIKFFELVALICIILLKM